ncbi:hypothetical protein Q0F98_00205 [Paenibacillus amylolyticus]|nr:hypothetical protein Q0F98_00205 [Paenibacillus amylolyticus]
MQYVTGWSMSTWPVVNTIWILAGFCLILLLTLMISHLWTVKNNAVRTALRNIARKCKHRFLREVMPASSGIVELRSS